MQKAKSYTLRVEDSRGKFVSPSKMLEVLTFLEKESGWPFKLSGDSKSIVSEKPIVWFSEEDDLKALADEFPELVFSVEEN